jgi:hypothetical protein
MIFFRRNGEAGCTKVLADIDSDLPTPQPIFPFGWECGNADYAALLAAHLQKRLQDTIKTAHRLAYERGWRDAKSKKARKATEFANYFTEAAAAIAW